MDLKSIPLFSSLGQKMSWLSERQKVLAQNIANANTPGYVPEDLKKISFKAQLDQTTITGSLQMRVTDSRHIKGGSGGSADISRITVKSGQDSPDGNAVSLEDELSKMATTQMEYSTAVNLYRKHVDMIKIALGKGR